MQNRKRNNEKPKRRFRSGEYGPKIMQLYSKMPTAELAGMLGLTVKQIKNYVYRQNLGRWAKKESSYLSKINSEKGKKGGRPRKNEKIKS